MAVFLAVVRFHAAVAQAVQRVPVETVLELVLTALLQELDDRSVPDGSRFEAVQAMVCFVSADVVAAQESGESAAPAQAAYSFGDAQHCL